MPELNDITQKRIDELEKQCRILSKQSEQLEVALARRTEQLDRRQNELDHVKGSHAYKFAHGTQKLVERFFPLYSRRRTILKQFVKLTTAPARWAWKRRQAKNGPSMQERFQIDSIPQEEYERWIAITEPNANAIEKQRQSQTFPFKISIVVPVYNPPASFLEEMIASVKNQTASNWELCLADASTAHHVRPILEKAKSDARIKVRYLESNQGIAGNSNAALSLATGDWIALLDHDDTLAPFAIHELSKTIQSHSQADLIYSDEDKLNRNGQRTEPLFKPDWSPETLRSRNYLCHFTAIRKSLVDELQGFREGFDGAQDYDLFLRASELARKVVHIPAILYHWRAHDGSTAANYQAKTYAFDAGQKAIEQHLARCNAPGKVYHTPIPGTYRVQYDLTQTPKVSVIIPNQNHAAMLARCVEAVTQSTYPNYEILIVENGSTESDVHRYYETLAETDQGLVLNWTKPFNYASVNNFAAHHATGEMFLFLNNDIEAIEPNWLSEMVRQAIQPGIGAVGAKLLYPDDTVQHAGIVVGMGGAAGHGQVQFPSNAPGYHQKLLFTQNVAAVTGACLMIPKHVFDRVGGFDEGFVLAFNDVDLCMQILAAKYRIVWTPDATLYHLESKTRGQEDTVEKQRRFKREYDLFLAKWSAFLKQGDPYYSPHFRLDRADVALKAA
jgi:O-antigen biosynthesis protein